MHKLTNYCYSLMVSDQKQLIRRDLMAAKKAIPDFARKTKNEKIFASLSRTLPWKTYSSVHIYESIDSLKEIDTKAAIAYLTKTYPLLSLFTSRKINGEWKNVSLDGEDAEDLQFDVIVVPTLGFDNTLNRLGYGSGYYDRFLHKQSKAVSVGLCYEEGHVKKLPVEKHDIALNYIISEKGIYTEV